MAIKKIKFITVYDPEVKSPKERIIAAGRAGGLAGKVIFTGRLALCTLVWALTMTSLHPPLIFVKAQANLFNKHNNIAPAFYILGIF